MSLRSRARKLQQLTTFTYQQALDRLRALGARPALLSRGTGWPLDVCDRYLVCGRAPIAVVAAPAEGEAAPLPRLCATIRAAIGAERVRVTDLGGHVLADAGADAPGTQSRTFDVGGRGRLVVDFADGLAAGLVDLAVEHLRGDLKRALVAGGLPAPPPRPDARRALEALARRHRLPSVDLDDLEIADAALALVTLGFARRYSLVPLARDGQRLLVAVADPASRYAVNVLRFRTGLAIDVIVADERQVDETLERLRDRGWSAPRVDDE
jgi:hypothetical protein